VKSIDLVVFLVIWLVPMQINIKKIIKTKKKIKQYYFNKNADLLTPD
jgi:hypothetical protein